MLSVIDTMLMKGLMIPCSDVLENHQTLFKHYFVETADEIINNPIWICVGE